MSMYLRVMRFGFILHHIEELNEKEIKIRDEFKLLTQTDRRMIKMLEDSYFINLMEQGMFDNLEHLNNEFMKLHYLRNESNRLKEEYNNVVNLISSLQLQAESLCYGNSKVEEQLKNIYREFRDGKMISEFIFNDDI